MSTRHLGVHEALSFQQELNLVRRHILANNFANKLIGMGNHQLASYEQKASGVNRTDVLICIWRNGLGLRPTNYETAAPTSSSCPICKAS